MEKKNLTFFKESEDLQNILEQNFKNVEIVEKISTGWTNIVIEFVSNNEKYIARFPRNDVFAKVIEKDVAVNKFLKRQINLKTTDMNIYCDNEFNRQFSIHKKIEGVALTNRISTLTSTQITKITTDIANFYSQIHSIKLNDIPANLKVKLSDFLVDISQVDDNYYDYSDINDLKQDEKNELVFVHGDLNIGNILLDSNDNIVAFIDFAFAGLSDIYADLSRMSCRVNANFLESILTTYEKINNRKIDYNKIKQRNKMWNYIEEQYIVYIRNNFPEIKI